MDARQACVIFEVGTGEPKRGTHEKKTQKTASQHLNRVQMYHQQQRRDMSYPLRIDQAYDRQAKDDSRSDSGTPRREFAGAIRSKRRSERATDCREANSSASSSERRW
jgi:hypothetical protein